MNTLPFIVTGTGLLTALLCIPLILGKVKPNLFYGIRTRAAFSSEQNWYRINRYGGKVLIIASGIITIVGASGFLVPEPYRPVYGIIAAVISLAAILVSGVILMRTS